ncbi:MAG: rRNA methyltransferase [Gammaproteobacteria bacterium]|nr:rRNA methyltransferase [Gammaproteobacteria bacterium]
MNNKSDSSRVAPRKEIKYYGLAACLALWRARPQDVIRIYLSEDNLKPLGDLLKWAAAQRRAYHIVGDDELECLTDSIHHQGVCLLANEPAAMGYKQFKETLEKQRGPMLLAYLDGVENPHNLGAIVRTCAHLGVDYLLGESGRLPRLSASACRVAEGGAEQVKLIHLLHRDKALADLKKLGFKLLVTAADGKSIYSQPYPQRTVLVMGAEQTGVSADMRNFADGKISVPGTGRVESLNVSVAFAILAAEFQRQQSGG